MTDFFSIPTRYRGIEFRSRLEARWAMVFDRLGIRWVYEPVLVIIAGRPYLPDFRLVDCGTWIEVKGDEGRIDRAFLLAAAAELPDAQATSAAGSPSLMILGPIPAIPYEDFGWLALRAPADATSVVSMGCAGFGGWAKNRRPWWNCNCQGFAVGHGGMWTWPCTTADGCSTTQDAYRTALSSTF